jgi:hypothetical protein
MPHPILAWEDLQMDSRLPESRKLVFRTRGLLLLEL